MNKYTVRLYHPIFSFEGRWEFATYQFWHIVDSMIWFLTFGKLIGEFAHCKIMDRKIDKYCLHKCHYYSYHRKWPIAWFLFLVMFDAVVYFGTLTLASSWFHSDYLFHGEWEMCVHWPLLEK